MHTTQINVGGEEFICHHNGDYSGDVKVSVDPNRVEEGISYFEGIPEYMIVDIPFEVIKELVADWVRTEIIRKYEDISAEELFRTMHGAK